MTYYTTKLFGYHYINGYKIDVYGSERNEHNNIVIHYTDGKKIRRATEHYNLRGLGGNPYPDTIISYFYITLPNGQRVKMNICA